MAALSGFDTATVTATVTTPITGGATLATLVLPARAVAAGFDLSASDLDGAASPAITLSVGDAANLTRFAAADTIAQAGGTSELRPASSAWWRYPAGGSVLVQCVTPPGSGIAGTVVLTGYYYPGADVADVVRVTLRGLGVLAEGETPRAEDAAIALEALADVHETVRGKGLAARLDLAWSLALLPLFAVRPYAAMAGNLLADTFGASAQRAATMAARAAEGERELRRQTRKATSGEPVNLEPYDPPPFQLDYGVLA